MGHDEFEHEVDGIKLSRRVMQRAIDDEQI